MSEQEFGQEMLESAAKEGHKQAKYFLKHGKCSNAYLPPSMVTGKMKYTLILKALRDCGESSAHDVSDATGIEWKYASVTLSAMKKKGIVTSRTHEIRLAGNGNPLFLYSITDAGIAKIK